MRRSKVLKKFSFRVFATVGPLVGQAIFYTNYDEIDFNGFTTQVMSGIITSMALFYGLVKIFIDRQ